MKTFSALLVLCEGNPPVTSDADLWCVLWFTPQQTAEQIIGTPVVWGAIVIIMTSYNNVAVAIHWLRGNDSMKEINWVIGHFYTTLMWGNFRDFLRQWMHGWHMLPPQVQTRAGRDGTIWRWRSNAPQYDSRRCGEKMKTVLIQGNIAFILKLCYHWLNSCDIMVYLSVFIGYIPRSSHPPHVVYVRPGWHVHLFAVVPAMKRGDVVRSVQIFDGFVQDCSDSIALAMELLQSCTKPPIWHIPRNKQTRNFHHTDKAVIYDPIIFRKGIPFYKKMICSLKLVLGPVSI